MQAEQSDLDELLTPQEAATLFRWSPGTFYVYACRRKIPSIKIGRSLRFRRADLERLLEVRPAR